MGNGGYNGNGHRSVYVHHLHGELIVAVGVPSREASSRQVIVQPRQLVKTPQQFVDDFVRRLRDEAHLPDKPTTKVVYAGSPQHGFYITISEPPEAKLECIIDKVNQI